MKNNNCILYLLLSLWIVVACWGFRPESNNINNSNNKVSRRDWLGSTLATTATITTTLLPKPANANDRSYFPALTPPFWNRATIQYDLGRNAWALEQLLAFANVTATIRCNVIRLKTGGLWVHSPQWPTGEFCSMLDDIGGPVEHVVLPCNAFEHKAPIKAFLKKYPNAQVWIAPGQYGPLGTCGTSLADTPAMGYRVDGILGDTIPPWADEFDIATLYVDLPRNAGPCSEVAFCHRPTKTLVSTDAVVYVPRQPPSNLLSTYFDSDTLQQPNFWPKSVLQSVFLPLRGETDANSNVFYPGYEALADRLVRAPILRAVVDARAPNAVRDWILEQTTPVTTDDGIHKWDYDRIITSHFASPVAATPADVRACFAYLLEDDIVKLQSDTKLPPIACQDWELLDSINQFIAEYNAGEPAVFDFQRGCIAE